MMNGINSQATIAVLRSVFARHPSSNGAAENVVNTVKSVLKNALGTERTIEETRYITFFSIILTQHIPLQV